MSSKIYNAFALLLVCLFMSPFFQFVVSIFSFSLRVTLTEWAAAILTAAGDKVTATGNMIEANGNEFSVDPACMGLNMMVTSIMLGLVLVNVFQKKYRLILSWKFILILLMAVIILNIISNLFRIIILVKFVILPYNSMHDITGLLCLLVYVFAPATILARLIVAKYGKIKEERSISSLSKPGFVLHLLLFILVIAAAGQVMGKDKYLENTSTLKGVAGYKATQVTGNIIKLENKDALVYIKPIEHFYEADHNPMICWKGSGYELEQVHENTLSSIKVFTATLKKKNETLYTAWWYDNGIKQTTSQLQWRWSMLQQQPSFCIINITCSTLKQTNQQVALFRSNNYFKQIFEKDFLNNNTCLKK